MKNRYVSPSLNLLIERADKLSSFYQTSNLTRQTLIHQFSSIHLAIKQAYQKKQEINNTLHDFHMAGWIYGMEKIATEYKYLNPYFQTGYFKSRGSKLYKFLSDSIDISKNNTLTDNDKIIYLVRLYNDISNEHGNLMIDAQDLAILKLDLKSIIQIILKRMNKKNFSDVNSNSHGKSNR